MKRKTSQLIPSLDGLRAVSIGLVVFAHSINGHQMGMLGVRIFFVISGYLITYLLLKEFNSTGTVNLKRFYFRRTLRIFPPFYFYLLIIGILALFGVFSISLRDFIAALTYTSNYFVPENAKDSWALVHTWSLAVEEQFYLLYPPLLVILRKKKIFLVLVSILFLAPVLRVIGYHLFPDTQYVYESQAAYIYGFHANMDALASGCLLAFAAEHERCRKFLLKTAAMPQVAVIITMVLIYFANMQTNRPNYFLSVFTTFMNTAIALIIYWAITNSQNTLIGRILNTKALTFIGMISYSLYLWQQVFTAERMLPYFPLNLLLAFACAIISYYTVERYSLTLRTYLEQRKIKKQPALINS